MNISARQYSLLLKAKILLLRRVFIEFVINCSLVSSTRFKIVLNIYHKSMRA